MSTLVRAMLDLVSPATSLTLSTPESFEQVPGIWKQTDSTGTAWAFIGMALELPEDPESLQHFMLHLSRLPVAAFKLGLQTKVDQKQARLWKGLRHQADSELQAALRRARRNFLQQHAPLRRRQGFLVLQAPLNPPSEMAWRPDYIQSMACAVAHGYGILPAPMTPADYALCDLGATPVGGHTRTADIALNLASSAIPLTLQLALKELEAACPCEHHTVLTVATQQLVPSATDDTVRAHCVVRLHAQPEDLARTRELALTTLHKFDIRGTPLTHPTAQPAWPSRKLASRWPELSSLSLAAYAAFSPRLVGQPVTTPGMPLLTATGDLRTFDPFVGHYGNNTLIAGIAGTGRHFLAKELIVQHLAHPEKGAVWVVDDSCNYVQLADALGGTVVQPGQPNCGLDVLAALPSREAYEDNQALVLDWLTMLAEHTHPVDAVTEHLWEVALTEAWHLNNRVSLRDFVFLLSQVNHPRAKEAASRFDPFLGMQSAHERYFEHTLVLPESNFVVIDLSSIFGLPFPNQRRITQSAQVMIVLHWRLRCREDQRRKLLVIDDPSLVASPQLLCQTMRRCRKLNGGVLMLGRLSDTVQTGPLAEVVPYFDHLLVLQSTAETARMFDDEHGCGLPLVPEIARLHTQAGKQSELVLVSQSTGTWGRFAFRVDPLSYALYDPRPQAVGRYRELRSQGCDPLAAVAECATAQNP